MSVWNLIIFSGVAAAALISIGNRRTLAWIGAIFAAYIVSVLYWDMGLPNAEFIAGICDIMIVAAISWRAKYVWELWIGLLFLSSAFVNMTYLADNLIGADVIGHVAYSSILEAINIAAIIIIGGVSSFDKAGMVDGLAFRPWLRIFGRMRSVHSSHSSHS